MDSVGNGEGDVVRIDRLRPSRSVKGAILAIKAVVVVV
jgi:hypothetical protein